MALLFFILIASVYITLRSVPFFSRPTLVVEEPADGARISGGRVSFRGLTQPEMRLTVNGYEIYSDSEGRFAFSLPFMRGFHILDMRVKNRLGREAKVVRRIMME